MLRSLIVGVLVLGFGGLAQGALKPDEVAVVAMGSSAKSRQMADYYAAVRGVPKSQILLLEGAAAEEISRDEWEKKYRDVIRDWLRRNKFETKVRCILLCWDVPLKITRRSDNLPEVKERRDFLASVRANRLEQVNNLVTILDTLGRDQAAQPRTPLGPGAGGAEVAATFNSAAKSAQERVRGIEASDKRRAAEAVLERVLLNSNGLAFVVRALALRPDEGGTPQAKAELAFVRGQMQAYQEGLQSITSLPDTTARDSQVLGLLQKAGGVLGVLHWIDEELEALQKNETYASFESELALLYWPDYPLVRWQPNLLHHSWEGVASRRTTLMVSRLSAPTFELAMKLIDTAVEVERKGLTGKTYLDARGVDFNPKTDTAGSLGQFDQSLRDLAERIRKHTKLEVVLDNRAELFATGACPDAALYCGWYSLGNYVDSFTWRPGAIGYHLASMEAQTLTTPGNRVWCNAMLERGICATLGPTNEPYLLAFPLPDEFFSLLLTGKYTLAEAYYRTLPYNSWVMVLVGDPLYTPFARNPQLTEDALPDRLKKKQPPPGITIGGPAPDAERTPPK